jgi:hypothetical protein
MCTQRLAKASVVELPVSKLLFVKYIWVRLIYMGIVFLAATIGTTVNRRWL